MASVLLAIVAVILAAVLALAICLALATRRLARNAEGAVPASGSFVTVDGERIHYVERGEGKSILMIHGLGGTLHHLRRPLMEEFGDGYRLIALDRPGSGYSTRGDDGASELARQALFVSRFINAMGIDRPLLVGHSLGGAIALATALDYPQKVAGLALISPLTHWQEPSPAFRALAIRSPFMRRLVANTLALPMSVRNAPVVLDAVFGPQQPPSDYAVAGGALAGLRPSHFYATSTDFVALDAGVPRQQVRYGELAMPVGILFGTGDRILDHRLQGLSMQGKVANLDIELLDGVGHMPQYAETARTVAFVRRMAGRSFVP